METLSIIVLIMLTMVGYSSGITLASRGKNIPPSLADLLVVLVLWIVALRTRLTVLEFVSESRFLLLILWLIIALAIGFIKTKAYRNGMDKIPDTELPEHAQLKTERSGNPFKRAWEGWKVFAAEMGHVQGGLFMGYFYFIVVTLFGIGARVFTDPMGIKTTPAATGWIERRPLDGTIDEAREQGQTG